MRFEWLETDGCFWLFPAEEKNCLAGYGRGALRGWVGVQNHRSPHKIHIIFSLAGMKRKDRVESDDEGVEMKEGPSKTKQCCAFHYSSLYIMAIKYKGMTLNHKLKAATAG